MKKKTQIGILFVLFILIIGALYVPINANPPSDTRMILEHTYKTYIAPPCFGQAEATNNLGESNLGKALELDYKAESSCTEDHLKPVKKPVIQVLAEKIGLVSGNWDW